VGEPVTTLAAASAGSAAPGTLAFVVVFGMAVVLTLLFRSMSKHLRKVNSAARRDDPPQAPAKDQPGDRPGPR
jgi:cobalamin biosynthesis protein CobD/CbiB